MEEGQGFMALEEYVRKRKFEKTPEPPPKTKAGETEAAGAAPRFYVQRHDATRLHYDFRLEIGGVLVPGGFGERGVEGKILAAQYAREKGIPYLGLCLGMQIATIEFARNV